MGDNTTTEVMQEVCESVDTSKYATGVITARSVFSDGAALYVEGSDDGQSFIVLLSIPSGTMGTAQSVHLNRSLPFGSGARLYRILRWRLATSGIAWEYCGRANVVLK